PAPPSSSPVSLHAALPILLPSLPVPAGIKAEHLCHDPAVVNAYREDPLVHETMTPRLFTEASSAMALAHRRAERIRVPLLFLIADRKSTRLNSSHVKISYA